MIYKVRFMNELFEWIIFDKLRVRVFVYVYIEKKGGE